jgi:uncharacterized membrane protein YciS (DUF1049 family)
MSNAKTLLLVSVLAIFIFSIFTGADFPEEEQVDVYKKLLAASEEKLEFANKRIEG